MPPLAGEVNLFIAIYANTLISGYDDRQLVNEDFATLNPPNTVLLLLDSGVLSVFGSAPHRWIEEMREKVKSNPHIRYLDEKELVDDDLKALNPPDGVDLALENGILKISGAAPHQWIVQTRKKVENKLDIQRIDESALVDSDLFPLNAPASVKLTLTKGILAASGSAPHYWIKRTRERIENNVNIQQFDESNLVDLDLSELNPPKSVKLTLRGTTLIGVGSAPNQWIRDARKKVRLNPRIHYFDKSNLVDLDLSELSPPNSVALTLRNGTLTAVGSAPNRWIKDVRKKVRRNPNIQHFDERRLVDGDLSTLNPPKTVSLSLNNKILTVKGSASHEWIIGMRRKVVANPRISRIDEKKLIDIDFSELGAPKTVQMTLEHSVLTLAGSAPHEWINKVRQKAKQNPRIHHIKDERLVDLDFSDLNPPGTVSMDLNNSILTVVGKAPHQWIIEMRKKVKQNPRIHRVNDQRLVDMDLSDLNPPKTVSITMKDSVLIVTGTASRRWINIIREKVKQNPRIKSIDEKKLIIYGYE